MQNCSKRLSGRTETALLLPDSKNRADGFDDIDHHADGAADYSNDQGDADDFLEGQLRPERLQAICTAVELDLTLRMQPGYDHSYYFISTFMAEHVSWHAARLKA